MDWVKRNLVFVLGAAVSLVLLVLSGVYLYANSGKNSEAKTQLEAEYNELQRLANLKPHPGKGDVDNIRRAKEQRNQLGRVMKTVRESFKPIPAIPASAEVTGEEFSAELRRTLDYLDRLATYSSVMVPTNYSFSFEAEKRLVKFAPGSLNRLAVQLGEVKAISEVLFEAKVNKLTGLRRERVSADDYKGPQTDYVARASVTNELAVVSPYEISFESFSAELADVMTGFANSPHGLVVKGVNVRPASAMMSSASPYGYGGEEGAYGAASIYAPAAPVYGAPPVAQRYGGGGRYGGEGEAVYGGGGELGARYGGGGGGSAIRPPTFTRPDFSGGAGGGGYGAASPTYGGDPLAARGGGYGQATPPAYANYGAGAAGYPGVVGGVSQTLIDEEPLSVTMVVEIIKLLPESKE